MTGRAANNRWLAQLAAQRIKEFMMKLELRYFARLREQLDRDQEDLEVPEDVDTVGRLIEWLRLRGDAWAQALGPQQAVCAAVDQVMAQPSTGLHPGAEVALFPPVTGG